MHMRANAYDQGLERNSANHVALSPLSFLERTAHIYPNRVAVVHGALRQTWGQTYTRCRQLASALQRRGVQVGDTVAAMLPNTPAMVECHFGVPMSGAVLNTLNTRLDAEAIAFQLDHAEARVLFTDREFSSTVKRALALMTGPKPLVIDVADAEYDAGVFLGEKEYDEFLSEGDPEFAWSLPGDEWDAIALNYTSGTTGNPKGVVTHHRGAYLNAVSNVVTWAMPRHATYLWTLPMFHCNGWCFPWTMALQAGTSVCLRRIDPTLIFPLIREHHVTHLCGAPIVYGLLINAPASRTR
jgi:fatty-acyl-CoA synthase